MNSVCRFCRGKTKLLYTANRPNNKKKDITDYACTSPSFGLHGPLVRCQNCEIIYLDENDSQEKISTYYKVAEDPVYFAEQPARRLTFQKYLRKLEKYFPNKGKLLDVGTNTGLFVRLALDHGWQAAGLEPNKWAVEYAKKNYRLNLINKPFEKGTFEKGSFSAITMWDVIEHFTDPIAEMEKVYWYLKPGGVFAFSTVDPESLLARAMGTKWSWFMEMHRVFFTQAAAKKYLTEAGFTKIIFISHWRNLSLGYLATRLTAVNTLLSNVATGLISLLGLSKVIVPYYANDLYDCYAFKI